MRVGLTVNHRLGHFVRVFRDGLPTSPMAGFDARNKLQKPSEMRRTNLEIQLETCSVVEDKSKSDGGELSYGGKL